MKLSIVIPNYNGATLLQENLPIAFKSLVNCSETYEIIVVDDHSSDNSIEILQQSFPAVRIIANNKNYGFSRTCNVGIAAANGEFICIANSDVQFSKMYFTNALAILRKTGAFATIGDIHNYINGKWNIHRTAAIMSFKRGLLRFSTADNINPDKFGWTSGSQFVSLGCCFTARTEELKKLGGFNEIFSPFYWEDTDLCIRALKAGLHVEYCFDCPVIHYSSSTINKTQTNTKRRLISQRNKFMFTWMHMTKKREKLLHAWYLFYNLAFRWIVLDWKFYTALVSAAIRYYAHHNKVWSILLKPSVTK